MKQEIAEREMWGDSCAGLRGEVEIWIGELPDKLYILSSAVAVFGVSALQMGIVGRRRDWTLLGSNCWHLVRGIFQECE